MRYSTLRLDFDMLQQDKLPETLAKAASHLKKADPPYSPYGYPPMGYQPMGYGMPQQSFTPYNPYGGWTTPGGYGGPTTSGQGQNPASTGGGVVQQLANTAASNAYRPSYDAQRELNDLNEARTNYTIRPDQHPTSTVGRTDIDKALQQLRDMAQNVSLSSNAEASSVTDPVTGKPVSLMHSQSSIPWLNISSEWWKGDNWRAYQKAKSEYQTLADRYKEQRTKALPQIQSNLDQRRRMVQNQMQQGRQLENRSLDTAMGREQNMYDQAQGWNTAHMQRFMNPPGMPPMGGIGGGVGGGMGATGGMPHLPHLGGGGMTRSASFTESLAKCAAEVQDTDSASPIVAGALAGAPALAGAAHQMNWSVPQALKGMSAAGGLMGTASGAMGNRVGADIGSAMAVPKLVQEALALSKAQPVVKPGMTFSHDLGTAARNASMMTGRAGAVGQELGKYKGLGAALAGVLAPQGAYAARKGIDKLRGKDEKKASIGECETPPCHKNIPMAGRMATKQPMAKKKPSDPFTSVMRDMKENKMAALDRITEEAIRVMHYSK
jgi:hypothetical protein